MPKQIAKQQTQIHQSEQPVQKKKKIKKIAPPAEKEKNQTNNKTINNKNLPLEIFVSGIPYEATDEQVKEVFKDCGNIELLKLPRYQDSGRCIGYCHIRFSKQKQIKNALKKDGVNLGTRYLKVQRAVGQKPVPINTQPPPIGCKTLFVKNLPYEITEQNIRKLFQRCGKIANVRMVYDSFHNHFKGFCYIDFVDPSSVKSGLKMHGSEFEGRKLIIQFATTPAKKGYKPKYDKPLEN